MTIITNQGELFPSQSIPDDKRLTTHINISKDIIIKWQDKINNHQSFLFSSNKKLINQRQLFPEGNSSEANLFNPLSLAPLALSFWRLSSTLHKGPALYLVMDKPSHLETPLLLYIGETAAANLRWKGEHDCKKYLNFYKETLESVGMKSQLSIRFWTDVPSSTKPRRRLEKEMINLWLPAFNKETKSRWATPFTAELN